MELRAYEIYLKRGVEPVKALDDWLAAEKELSASQTNAPRLTSPSAFGEKGAAS